MKLLKYQKTVDCYNMYLQPERGRIEGTKNLSYQFKLKTLKEKKTKNKKGVDIRIL